MTINLNEQANKILDAAQRGGVEQNFLFVTTFKRYQVQLRLLGEIEKELADGGITVTKEYIKGRMNVYSHPAVGAYSKMADSANRTAATLMKIIISLKDTTMSPDEDDEL